MGWDCTCGHDAIHPCEKCKAMRRSHEAVWGPTQPPATEPPRPSGLREALIAAIKARATVSDYLARVIVEDAFAATPPSPRSDNPDLRAALTFYADERTYEADGQGVMPVEYDGGGKARAALRAALGSQPPEPWVDDALPPQWPSAADERAELSR